METRTKIGIFIFTSLLAGSFFTSKVLADGGATVSWIAPTTDQGGGTLSGLSGYRVYYSASAINCTNWNAAYQTNRTAGTVSGFPTTFEDVSGGGTTKFAFSTTNDLTHNTAYNFAVVAYDSTGNLSNCATGTGGVTSVPKAVTYSGDVARSIILTTPFGTVITTGTMLRRT